ncbi:MAG: CoA transferase [Deltaproteobacteria bacterium]|nr:CoA transferase [Deltaproteobacteria bacterium]
MSDERLDWFTWAEREMSPAAAEGKAEALDDVTVLDLSYGNVGGLFCSSLLAECGATVIRVEPPGGDVSRRYTPEGLIVHDSGLGYIVEGRNKHHVTLDILRSEGKVVLREMVSRADVLIETYPSGFMDREDIGYRQLSRLNPRLIYLTIYPYGQFGPESAGDKPSSDIIDQAASGLVYLQGQPASDGEKRDHEVPTRIGSWFGWYSSGLYGAFSIMGGLLFRHASGEGQMIDLSGAEGVMQFLDYNLTWFHTAKRVRERLGNYDIAVFPYTFVRCKDGFTFIAAYNDDAFQSLADIMGRPDLTKDPKFATFLDRTQFENEKVLVEVIEEWSVNHTADEILGMIQDYIGKKSGPGAAVVTGRVNTPADTLRESHWWVRGVFQKLHDPVYGEVLVQGPSFKMSETPPRIKWLCREVGADNRMVYSSLLGAGVQQIDEMKRKGII